MTLRTRKTIFYVLFALFFVIGGAVVLYAEGWRVDLGGHVEKVGAVFVRSYPTDASITLGDEPIPNGSGILSRGTLISNLFPRSYTITLKHDGFLDWHESATVLPSLVTEFKYAVLIPATSTPVATGTIRSFTIASNEMVLEGTSGAVTWRGEKIGTGSIVDASTNPKNVIIKSPAGSYLLYDFETGSSTNLSTILIKNGIDSQYVTNILIDPYDPTNIVIGTPARVAFFNTAAGTFTTIGKAPAGWSVSPAIAVSPSLIAWTRFAEASGTSIAIYDKFSGSTTTSTVTLAGRTAELQWIRNGALGVLQDGGALYSYDTGSRTFQKMADDVKTFEAASDGSSVAALEHKSLEIFPLTNATTYRRFNLPNVDAAKDLVWYKDMNHLFVVYPDRVVLLDLDDLGLHNFTTVADGIRPFYDAGANALYLVSPSQTLVRFDFPN